MQRNGGGGEGERRRWWGDRVTEGVCRQSKGGWGVTGKEGLEGRRNGGVEVTERWSGWSDRKNGGVGAAENRSCWSGRVTEGLE